MKNMSKLIEFPKNFSTVTCGVLRLEENFLITGHANGLVIKWDLKTQTPSIVFNYKSPINTLSISESGKLAIGSRSGGLVILSVSNPKEIMEIRDPTYDKYGRVWRTVWPDKNKLIMTSTYGEVKAFTRINEHWKFQELQGHSNSVFAVCSSRGKFLVTGDYRGNIRVWRYNDEEYEVIQKISVSQTVQDVAWHNDEVFSVIDDFGRIHIFEKDSDTSDSWQVRLEINVASSRGNCIHFTNDGKTIFAGTSFGVIQFDCYNMQDVSIPVQGVKKIFSSGNQIYLLSDIGLLTFEREEVVVKEDKINYKFAKISLLGHTGTGKTTFGNYIMYNTVEDVQSTFGKRVWNWILPKDNGFEKRIILSDHGGQEAVLETFFPFLKDSDLFLIFWKQTEKTSFENACKILSRIKELGVSGKKIVLVQTFIDHEMNVISDIELEQLKMTYEIAATAKISPKKQIGLEEFKEKIVNLIAWNKTRIMVKSDFTEGISKVLTDIQEKGLAAIPFKKFKTLYQQITKLNITDSHLEFLLKDYSNKGIIEYYPDISDLIIFNDETYNRLTTTIPIFVDGKGGVVSIRDLQEAFKDSNYLKIIDEMHSKSKISIKNEDLRIFPDKLKNNSFEMPEFYKQGLKNSYQIKIPFQTIEIGRLIETLTEIKLKCIIVNKSEGVFTWEDRAFIYYSFKPAGDNISGRFIQCTYYIGGNNYRREQRLTAEFKLLIKKLFGILTEEPKEVKKKESKKIKFDVALSFAGEQRKYVREVATILESKGYKVFYDEFYTAHLWGEDLVEHLKEVYYTKSDYCMMFISKEYVSKVWPVHERKCATAKDLEKFGKYILPVVFDKVDVPGLIPKKFYLNAKRYSPKEIAETFEEKYENQK